MRPLEAMAEDFRRVGVAGIITGLVGSFLEDKVPGGVGFTAAILGIVLNMVGYWFHRQAEKRQ